MRAAASDAASAELQGSHDTRSARSATGTINFFYQYYLLTAFRIPDKKCFPSSGNNSVVECDLAKVEVAGSNPVSRSKDLNPGDLQAAGVLFFFASLPPSAYLASTPHFGILAA